MAVWALKGERPKKKPKNMTTGGPPTVGMRGKLDTAGFPSISCPVG